MEEKKSRGLGKGLSELLGEARAKAAVAKQAKSDISDHQEEFKKQASQELDRDIEEATHTASSAIRSRITKRKMTQENASDNTPIDNNIDRCNDDDDDDDFETVTAAHLENFDLQDEAPNLVTSTVPSSLESVPQKKINNKAEFNDNDLNELEALLNKDNFQTEDLDKILDKQIIEPTIDNKDTTDTTLYYDDDNEDQKSEQPQGQFVSEKEPKQLNLLRQKPSDVIGQLPEDASDNAFHNESNDQDKEDYSDDYEDEYDRKKEANKHTIYHLPIELVNPNEHQPRKYFNEDLLKELAKSIEVYGVIQPIIVNEKAGEYIIVGGERRWRASQIAGLKTIPAIIKNYNNASTLEVSLIENIQRADLSALDEAKAYFYLIRKYELTQNELAQKVGKSRSYIANMIRLLDLDDDIRHYLDRGDLSIGHARALIGVKNAESWAKKAVQDNMSVRKLEEVITQSAEKTNSRLPKALNSGKNTDILALEADLKAALGVPVSINAQSSQKGNMVIRYDSLEQLDEICRRLCSNWGNERA
ncbi:MAG: ParB family chromosome partitioning protein [Alphaproteobacteria bacterium]|jgi:ParB family chromosome partitioning protein